MRKIQKSDLKIFSYDQRENNEIESFQNLEDEKSEFYQPKLKAQLPPKRIKFTSKNSPQNFYQRRDSWQNFEQLRMEKRNNNPNNNLMCKYLDENF